MILSFLDVRRMEGISLAWLTTDPEEIKCRLAWLTMRWYYLGNRGYFTLPGNER